MAVEKRRKEGDRTAIFSGGFFKEKSEIVEMCVCIECIKVGKSPDEIGVCVMRRTSDSQPERERKVENLKGKRI